MIRLATKDEAERLRQIEADAGELFRTVDMARVAENKLPSVAFLQAAIAAGRIWVDAPPGDEPAAYLLTDDVDGCLHIEQVSVHPSRAREGLGRGLIDHAEIVAGQRGLPALTLTTFAEVPWNGPYYRRLGFVELTGPAITPGLARIRDREDALGLDAWPRICMRREVRAAP
ncbi:MAG TPA: GNAT family N-acetyltransferase [Mycobacteriales bacterium]|nr:GNAT family N-acetyltransferase [Mycobacteriales bacterium]